ncbi:hypothetical protein P8452_03470 [Trifolium repens]|nr:basic helix-loop-helix (bHLH) DNA-binding superfamily protein [Trifolium repens]WJX13029.1 hypothetical protein P8452_03470 [Trifolium repens]
MKIESLADFSIYNYAFSGLVSDAVHLTFGCGLLTFSLFVMGASRKKPDGDYTYGYKLEVLSAFTNATDTTSVLYEAIGYIKFFHSQVEVMFLILLTCCVCDMYVNV